MIQPTINYIAVLVAAIVSMVLGALWYSPLLFAKPWMKLSGMTEQKMNEAKKKGMAIMYVLAFVGCFVTSYVMAHFVDYTEATTFFLGMQAGFWIWLGFLATTTLGMVLWEGKPWALWMLNNGHLLLNLLVMGGILAMWA